MIDDLRALAIFAKVAEAGSFSAAGRALRLSTSVVSHHVRALETRHGVTLLHRSTRALSLTSEGQSLLVSARRMVEAAEEGFDAIADISAEPAGALRLTAPAFLKNSPQEAAIWQFARRYPQVAVTLNSSDEQINLVAEGYDLAIRLGAMAGSTLRSRKIGTFERYLVAAPTYLETIEKPMIPQDLVRCDFVLLDMLPDKFVLTRGTEEVVVHPEQSRVLVNSISGARSAVLAGLGLQKLPLSEIGEDLAAGRLVRVLPEWSLPTLNIHAVWPASSRRSSLVKLLLDFILKAQTPA
ncbi:LysR family transcriptional regulator [Hoeflea sp. YIM 152468]|uniref:LysR family transcriptional regulator n=1 Tax=Hoeflea sp. YIM 152468 TaxID=3031759 RepID=UPI0023DC7D33|nr:LysR family transcriptional regulator [Hoeflea sp. YIM 152468]MDF1606596.1 LysR family transcriptional regulator [Hoeflea sp. YIM 152468]